MVDQVYRSCLISLDFYDTWVYIITLDMVDFDVILGMDWLLPHQAIFYCYTKTVTLAILGKSSIVW